MTTPTHDLAAEVLDLPADERARILELLIASFEPKSNAQKAWTNLALRRREEIRSGKVAMIPGDEALARVMAPTIVRDGQFRLFFFSREETRIHVHVAHADGEAKFWLTPEVGLASQTGLSATQIRQAQAVVNAYLKEIQNAWNQHFGG